MKIRNPLEVARASVEAFNERDWDTFTELRAPNAVYDEVGTARKLKGRAEILGAAQGWAEAFPDVKGTIEHSLVSEDTAVLEVTYRGTHEGELPGPDGPIAPTGKTINVRTLDLFRVEDGLIVEDRNYFDMLSMLQALGAIPAKAAKAAKEAGA